MQKFIDMFPNYEHMQMLQISAFCTFSVVVFAHGIFHKKAAPLLCTTALRGFFPLNRWQKKKLIFKRRKILSFFFGLC